MYYWTRRQRSGGGGECFIVSHTHTHTHAQALNRKEKQFFFRHQVLTKKTEEGRVEQLLNHTDVLGKYEGGKAVLYYKWLFVLGTVYRHKFVTRNDDLSWVNCNHICGE